jgi:hypothetical protein
MVAVAGADRELDDREIGLICQVYQDQSGSDRAVEVERCLANEAGRPVLGIRSGFQDAALRRRRRSCAPPIVLLADDRIAGEERKKLKDLAAALEISEIHFGAILEDLAVWLAAQKR